MSPLPFTAGLVAFALAPAVIGQTTFVNVAALDGCDSDRLGRGAAWADFDQDGLLDLALGMGAGLEPGDNVLYRQLPDHTFQDASVLWNVHGQDTDAFATVAADFDEDGDPDIYWANGGFEIDGLQPNQVLRNDIATTGTFTDISDQTGDGDLADSIFGAAAFDFDLDGDLDLFLSGSTRNVPRDCHLLEGDGAFGFVDVSALAGVNTRLEEWRHCTAGDFDLDGWPDIGVGCLTGANALFRNNGDGSFSDVAVAAGVDSPEKNYGFVFADFDNDGWDDVFLPKWNRIPGPDPSTFLRNQGDGTFLDVTQNTAITVDMGHGVADMDGDGYPDIFIGTGWPAEELDDILYWVKPDGLGGFDITDGSLAAGILSEGPTRNHGVAFADYDEDGDLDMYLNHGGMSEFAPDTYEDNVLYVNQGNGNHWLGVDLEGVLSSRDPFGARLETVLADGRSVFRTMRACEGFGNTSARMQHVGLGDQTGITRLEVLWPSGIRQTYLGAVADTRMGLRETGLRLTGEVDLGATVQLDACGGPAYVSELLLGTATTSLPLPQLHGILEIEPPFVGPISLPLDGQGRLSLPLPLPTDPALSGNSIYLQAWIHPAGTSADSTLSNLITLAFP